LSKLHWLALTSVPGVGGVTARKLIDRFGDIEAIFDATPEELATIPRVGGELAQRLGAVSLEALEEELSALSDEGIDVLTWDDADYPANLRDAADSPPVLFVRGALLAGDADAVAIAGTREPSTYTADLARKWALELASRGHTVVSGLALGIDTAAHRGALEAPEGRTLAVLGSGLRLVTPRENVELAEQVVRRGALLSEVRPGTAPRGTTLMARDRIITGLSRVTIIVEAREKSGSVDTGRHALRQGRPLFALAGSPGTNLLARMGAVPLQPDVDLDWLSEQIRSAAPRRDSAQLTMFET
jgi:DNA processing protein